MSADRQRVKHIISQIVLHIVGKLTGADFEAASPGVVDPSLQELIEKYVPVRVPPRPAHGARMLDDRADLKLWRLIAVMKACMDVLDGSPASMTTKRAIFYSNVQLFGKKQSAADRAIEQAVTVLANIDGNFGQFARHSLGIVAAKRGMVYGQIIYTAPGGDRHNCAQGTGWSIEPSAQGGKLFIHSDVDRVLVVEKETVFNKLAQAASDQAAPAWLKSSVLVTGKGYPDVATRTFLRALLNPDSYSVSSPKPDTLTVYGLVDGDPHGLDILSTYINGSRAMQYAGAALCIPEIIWLGLRHADIAKWRISEHALIPYTSRDRSVTARLLSDADRLAAVHSLAADHLRALEQDGTKAEIECLYETEVGLLGYVERAMADTSSIIRPVYDPSVSGSGAASSVSTTAGTSMVIETNSGSETQAKGARGTACAEDAFDWFTSEDESSEDDLGGAEQCAECSKWLDAQRMRGSLCYACWRRQCNVADGRATRQDRKQSVVEEEDFEYD